MDSDLFSHIVKGDDGGDGDVKGVFFDWSAQKNVKKCQITCKSLQKSSKYQNLLRVWHFSHF